MIEDGHRWSKLVLRSWPAGLGRRTTYIADCLLKMLSAGWSVSERMWALAVVPTGGCGGRCLGGVVVNVYRNGSIGDLSKLLKDYKLTIPKLFCLKSTHAVSRKLSSWGDAQRDIYFHTLSGKLSASKVGLRGKRVGKVSKKVRTRGFPEREEKKIHKKETQRGETL